MPSADSFIPSITAVRSAPCKASSPNNDSTSLKLMQNYQ